MRFLPLCLLGTTLFLMPCRSRAVTFQGLGDLPGGSVSSMAQGISDDGTTVVGQSDATKSAAFYWKAAGGIKVLYNASEVGIAYKLTSTGTSAAGREDGNGALAARYNVGTVGITYLGGLQPNGSPPNQGRAFSLSSDGSVIVGSVASPASTGGEQAFRYTGGTLTGIGFLGSATGNPYSEAHDVSGDGSVIVGFSSSADGQSAFRYTTAGGMLDLGRFAGDTSRYAANAISRNGNVIVGSTNGNRAFTWTQAGGLKALASLGSTVNPLDANDDGSVIVGSDKAPTDLNTSAVFWLNGVEFNLKTFLVNQGNTTVANWDLRLATGVSADGMTICGSGIDPSGNLEAFIATIPEPSTVPLIVLAAVGGLVFWQRRTATV